MSRKKAFRVRDLATVLPDWGIIESTTHTNFIKQVFFKREDIGNVVLKGKEETYSIEAVHEIIRYHGPCAWGVTSVLHVCQS